MIDAGLVSLLAADSGVAAILAAHGAGSIFQMTAPEDEAQYPCIVYQFAGGSARPTTKTSGMQKSRVQISCWAVQPDVAKNLADAVRLALNGYTGALSDGTFLSNAQMLHAGIDYTSPDSRFSRRLLEFYLFFDFSN